MFNWTEKDQRLHTEHQRDLRRDARRHQLAEEAQTDEANPRRRFRRQR